MTNSIVPKISGTKGLPAAPRKNPWKTAFTVLVGVLLVATLSVEWIFSGLSDAQSEGEAMLNSFATLGAAADRPNLFPSPYVSRAKLEELEVKIQKTGPLSVASRSCLSIIKRLPGCGFRYFQCTYQGKVADGSFAASMSFCPAGLSTPLSLMGLSWNANVRHEPSIDQSTSKGTAL